MKLSIIVPVYNVETYLKRCVDSLLTQDIPLNEYEVILVDDGSNDGSSMICDNYAREYSNIVVVHKKNGGAASARNSGLDIANGKYLMFVDSDDCIKANVLNRLLSVAEKFEAEICAYEMERLDVTGNIKYISQPFDLYSIYRAEEIIYSMNIATACAALYLHSYLKKNGIRFTNGIVNEDVDFNNRAYSLVKRMLFTDIIAYTYFWNSNSVNRSESIEKIKKRTLDDLQVAYNGIVYAKQYELSPQMIAYFRRKANSVVVSLLLSFVLKKLPPTLKPECLEKAISLGLYPIKGRTLSWKTTILSYFL